MYLYFRIGINAFFYHILAQVTRHVIMSKKTQHILKSIL